MGLADALREQQKRQSSVRVARRRRPNRGRLYFRLFFVATLFVILYIIRLQVLSRNNYWRVIEKTARRHGVDPVLIQEVIRKESSFRWFAIGGSGEMGLMQISFGARTDYNRSNGKFWRTIFPFDPAVNIEIGTWYLADSMRMYNAMIDPVPVALARYNAGQSRSDIWLNRARATTKKHVTLSRDEFLKYVSISSTRNYVRDIHSRYKKRKAESTS